MKEVTVRSELILLIFLAIPTTFNEKRDYVLITHFNEYIHFIKSYQMKTRYCSKHDLILLNAANPPEEFCIT